MGFGSLMGRWTFAAAGLGACVLVTATAADPGDRVAPAARDDGAVDAPMTAQQHQELIEQRIADAMFLDDFDVQSLDVPQAPVRAPIEIAVALAGRPTALVLTPNSVRTEDFAVYSRRGDGRLVREMSAAPATYRGHLADDAQAQVAATVRDGQVHAYIIDGTQLWIVEPVAESAGVADRSRHVVYNGADVRPGDWTCGAAAEPIGRRPAVAPIADPRGDVGSCFALTEIGIDADVDYYELNNSSMMETQADIESIINAMNVIYAFDVGITYEISVLIVHTDQKNDPFDTTSPFGMIDTFEMYRTANPYPDGTGGELVPDVAHLFTGKDLNGGVIGIATLGSICDSSRSYGVSQSRFSENMALRVQVTTHELGHNWNARHCDGDSDCAIMCSAVGSCTGVTDAFGNRSRLDITDFRNSVDCLGDGAIDFPAATELQADDADDNDNFGISVALAGRVALVGAYADDEIGDNAGAAYAFQFDGEQWVQEAKLLPMELEAGDRFGNTLAIEQQGSQHVAAVAAFLDDGDFLGSGSVYVYERQGGAWTLVNKLIADDKGSSDLFGTSVDVHGEFIIVGSPRDNPKGSDSGSAYIYRYDGMIGQWVQHTMLTAGKDLGDPSDQYGSKVAISSSPETGTIAAVAAWLDDESANNAGSVYLYQYDPMLDQWNFQTKLCPADADDQFGISLALDGTVLAVGAWGDDTTAPDGGAVYLFEHQGGSLWQQTAKLTDAVQEGDRLGGSMALEGSVLAAGAYFTDLNMLEDAGNVHVYRYDGAEWGSLQLWRLKPPGEEDQFGVSVAVSGDLAMAGAWRRDDSPIVNSGIAGIFLVGAEPVDCNGNDVPDACDILSGVVEDCNDNGVPDECDIADGTVSDMDGNGVPDVCDTDCNDNGITDTTEIADGSVPDCNENGFPDSCDIDPTDPDGDGMVSNDVDGDGVPDECGPDCNNNGVPDPFDIANGDAMDCNGNVRPDSCDIVQYVASSGPLSPVDGATSQTLTLSSANNNAPPLAEDDVTITIAANGDFDGLDEAADFLLDGVDIDTLFLSGAAQCAVDLGLLPDIETVIVPRDQWNDAIVDDGVVNLTFDPRSTVSGGTCPNGFVTISVQYPGGDCDGNGELDICAINAGEVADCNGNSIPDSCEIADGYADDTNGNGIPDACESCLGDLTGDFVVDVFDLLELLAAWGSCPSCPEDLTDDDTVDVFDLLELLTAWGACS